MIALFTSFQGRIGRGQWWLGSVILFVVPLIIALGLLLAVGLDPLSGAMRLMSGGAAANSPEVLAMLGEAEGPLRIVQWVMLGIYVITSIMFVALSVKRRHDRNKSGIDVVIFVAVTLVLQVLSALGIGAVVTQTGNEVRIGQEGWLMAIGFASFVYFIYVVVVCGFLRGDQGGNNYGADPIDGSR